MLASRSVPNASAAHTRNPPAPRVSPGMSSIPVGWRGQGITVERSKLLFLTHREECFGTQFPHFSAMTKMPGKRSPRRGRLRRPHPARRETFLYDPEDLEIALLLKMWVPLAVGPAAEHKENETQDFPPGPLPGEGAVRSPSPAEQSPNPPGLPSQGRFLPFFFLEGGLAVWAGGVAFLWEARGGWDESDLPEA
ncbi:hypothetical protein DPX16_21610 [Anabarilius grahami]|uniref:Uncharacterized protein n=1 Tax=Anabarilius grahami TaxID=495550 RepID=A0A3N0XEU4_ANAGA|nr:hypothetical protein DPX16_21610 [Anabarilius grahami]